MVPTWKLEVCMYEVSTYCYLLYAAAQASLLMLTVAFSKCRVLSVLFHTHIRIFSPPPLTS